jgi:hypothetical protein
MGKKIVVKWQGERYEARYQVDTVTGQVKDLNRQPVDKGDLMAVIANLHGQGKSEIAKIIQNRYF